MVALNPEGENVKALEKLSGLNITHLWRAVSRERGQGDSPAPARNNPEHKEGLPAHAPANSGDFSMQDFMQTAKALKETFGPSAEAIFTVTFFGENSPLVGQFKPTAHMHLTHAVVSGILGYAAIRQAALARFIETIDTYKREGEGIKGNAVLAQDIEGLIPAATTNLRLCKNFHETFAAGAEKVLEGILFGQESPLHGQFRPDAKHYLILHAMREMLDHSERLYNANFLAQFFRAIERQKTEDRKPLGNGQPKPPEKCIKAEPDKVNRETVAALLLLLRQRLPARELPALQASEPHCS